MEEEELSAVADLVCHLREDGACDGAEGGHGRKQLLSLRFSVLAHRPGKSGRFHMWLHEAEAVINTYVYPLQEVVGYAAINSYVYPLPGEIG